MSQFDDEDEFWESDEAQRCAEAIGRAAEKMSAGIKRMHTALTLTRLSLQDMQLKARGSEPGSFSANQVEKLLRSTSGKSA